jgi:hypothetical protein
MNQLKWLLLLSSTSWAQLIRDAPKPAAAPESPSVTMASLARERIDRDLAPDEDPLSVLMMALFPGQHGKSYVERMQERGRAFDEVWARYQERQRQVDAAVAEAGPLDGAAAEKRLVQVITPAERDAHGYLKSRANTMDASDAEVAALDALFAAASKRKDFATLIDICALMEQRQKIGDQADERLLYVLEGFTDDKFVWQFLKPMGRYLRSASTRERDAGAYYQKVQKLGLRAVQLGASPVAKAGEWVQFRMLQPTLGERQASTKKHYEGMTDYDCHDTGKIASYDRSNGQFHYQERCKQKRVVVDLSVDVAFAQPLPEWARSGRDLAVVGKVVKAGPRWRIAEAFVCDRSVAARVPVSAF